MRHECNTSNTSATQVKNKGRECDTNNAIATRVKNFDFDNGTSENIFLHHYISYMTNERLPGEQQSNSKN